MTHLKDLSKVYLESIAESAVPGKPAERLGAVTAIPKSEQDAARERILAKTAAKREAMKTEALDPVGQEDADVDNDGKKNTNADKYLMKRRKAIGKALTTRKEETEITEIHAQAHKPHEVPDKNLKSLVSKAVKRIDTDVDGDTDNNDKTKGELGEFIPGVGNKRLYSSTRTKTVKERYSNWRQDLFEINSDEENKEIKEKKVNNTVKINPKLSEAVEEIGGTLIEMVEINEVDFVIESVYNELFEEGYQEDDIEEALEYALTEAKVTFGHDTPTGQKKRGNLVKAVGRLARQKLASKVRGAKSAAKQAVATGARKVAKKALGVARKMEGGDSKPSAAQTKTRTASTYRGVGAGTKERVSSGSYTPPTKKKAEKPADPWEGSATTPSKTKAKKAAAPKAKAPAKKKKSSKLDDLLASVRSEETRLIEGDLRPGETYMQYAKRKEAERKKPKDTRHVVTAADKKANTLAYQNYKKGDKRYKAADHLGEENLEEKAVSKAQQRFMGMVHAMKKGEMKAPSPEVAKAAASMTDKEAKKFAKTKHEGLPEKKEVKESSTEVPMSPQELALQKRKTALDILISKKRQQSMQKQGKE